MCKYGAIDSFDTLTQFRGFLCYVDVGTCVRAWWFGFGYQLWLLNLKFQPKGKQNEFLNNRILPYRYVQHLSAPH